MMRRVKIYTRPHPSLKGLSVYFIAVRMRAPDVALRCSGCHDCCYVGQFDVPMHCELPLAIWCPQCSRELTLETRIDRNTRS